MRFAVTPYAGVWIEIDVSLQDLTIHIVTPYAGVWIEIRIFWKNTNTHFVTPYAGVWIEIADPTAIVSTWTSLPTRECGLKLDTRLWQKEFPPVTPYAGVWIEIDDVILFL